MTFTSEKPTVPGAYYSRTQGVEVLDEVYEEKGRLRTGCGYIDDLDREWSPRLVPVDEVEAAFNEGASYASWHNSRARRVVEGGNCMITPSTIITAEILAGITKCPFCGAREEYGDTQFVDFTCGTGVAVGETTTTSMECDSRRLPIVESENTTLRYRVQELEENPVCSNDLTVSKTKTVLHRDSAEVFGFVTKDQKGQVAIIAGGAVRWLSKEDLWRLMHDTTEELSDAGSLSRLQELENQLAFATDQMERAQAKVKRLISCGDRFVSIAGECEETTHWTAAKEAK